jgi:hypothetical protein
MIKNTSNTLHIDRVFVVSGKKNEINGVIKYEPSLDDDLMYTFKVDKLENTQGA